MRTANDIQRDIRKGVWGAQRKQVERELHRAYASDDPKLLPRALPFEAKRDRLWAVYFIHAPEVSRIKIGCSRDVNARIIDLRIGSPCPLVPLGWVPGGKSVERMMHVDLEESRTHGEWFDTDPRVLSYLRRFGVELDPLYL